MPGDGPGRYDLVVVGAGLMGACAAWAASRRGLRTAVVEQHEPGHRHGSSHGTSRIFRRAYGDPFYVELTARAADSWARLEDDAGTALRAFTGAIDHGSGRDVPGIAAHLRAAEVRHELLDATAAGERWPHLVFTTDVLHHPDAGVLDADRTVATALERAAAHGADVRLSTTVTTVVPGENRVVVQMDRSGETATLTAGAVVLAAGAWNPVWFAELLGTSAPPLTVTQQQVAHFQREDPAESWPAVVHKETVNGQHLQIYAMPAGRAAPGAIKVGEHDRGTVTTAGTRNGEVDAEALDRMAGYVRRFFPSLVPEPFLALSCLYTRTASEDFVVDRAGPLIACSPCSGHGAKFAPYIGELITAMVLGDDDPPPRFRLAAHASPVAR